MFNCDTKALTLHEYFTLLDAAIRRSSSQDSPKQSKAETFSGR